MKNTLILAAIVLFAAHSFAQTNYNNQWPGFRDPFAKGFIENTKTVSEWNLETNENIFWQPKIPGIGHSCPVILGNKMFITTAISGSGTDKLKVGLYGDIDATEDESEHEFNIYCLDKKSGEIVWEKLAHYLMVPPAISEDAIYFREQKSVIAVGQKLE